MYILRQYMTFSIHFHDELRRGCGKTSYYSVLPQEKPLLTGVSPCNRFEVEKFSYDLLQTVRFLINVGL